MKQGVDKLGALVTMEHVSTDLAPAPALRRRASDGPSQARSARADVGPSVSQQGPRVDRREPVREVLRSGEWPTEQVDPVGHRRTGAEGGVRPDRRRGAGRAGVERGVAVRARHHARGGARLPEDAAQLPHAAGRGRRGSGSVREHDGAADPGCRAEDGTAAARLDAYPVEHQVAHPAGALRRNDHEVPQGAARRASEAVRQDRSGALWPVPRPRRVLRGRTRIGGTAAVGGIRPRPLLAGDELRGTRAGLQDGVVPVAGAALRRPVRAAGDGLAGARRAAGAAALVVVAEPVGPRPDIRAQGQGLRGPARRDLRRG